MNLNQIKFMKLRIDNLIGDTLMCTPALREFKLQNPQEKLICRVKPGSNSYWMLKDNPYLDELEISEVNDPNIFLMDAGSAFQEAVKHTKSLTWGFGKILGVEITDTKYDLVLSPTIQEYRASFMELAQLMLLPIQVSRHCSLL